MDHRTVTSRVGQAAAQDGVNKPDPPLVLGYVSLRHSITASTRTALAYSNIRRIWWPLAYLDLPFLFLLFSGVLALQPNTFVSLGTASGHLNRAGQPGAVPAPRAARLLWLVFTGGIVVDAASVPIAVLAVAGPGPSTVTVMKAWWLIVLGVPFLGYILPALIQSYRGRGVATWTAATTEITGRTAVLVSVLGSWPCTGGGKTGGGNGFELVRALAAEARSHGQIMVGVARTTTLAGKYIARTGAESSADNPRHLRWP